MTLRVVILDVFEIRRLLTKGLWVVPVQMSDPLVQVWIAGSTETTLAMPNDRAEHAIQTWTYMSRMLHLKCCT